MEWIIKKNKLNLENGQKGFQKVNESEKLKKKILITLGENQKKILDEYCKAYSITKSELIRMLLYDHFKKENYI